MDATAGTAVDLNHVSFKDVAWLQAHGLGEHNALDYFALSQFYDRQCLNEVVKMQTKFNDLNEMHAKMSEMTGFEYVLAHVQPPVLYVVKQQERYSKDYVEALAYFYILDGTIFKVPTMLDIVASRMTTTTYHLEQALHLAQTAAFFHPSSKRNAWRLEDEAGSGGGGGILVSAESTTTDATVAALDDSTGRETFFRQRIDNVLAAMVAKRQSDMNVDAER